MPLSESLVTRMDSIRGILPDSSKNNMGAVRNQSVLGWQTRSANVVKTRGEVANLASPLGLTGSGHAPQNVQ